MERTDVPVALVTGGAGGIGRAISRRLADRGCRVVVADLDAAAAGAVAADVGGRSVGVDVSDPDGCRAAVEAAVAGYGRLDVVALNAGVSSGLSANDSVDMAAYRRIVGVNVDGVVFGIDAAVPALLAADGIRINALCPGFTDTTILGVARPVFESAGFPLLGPEQVAGAFTAILDAGGSGEAWFVQPGREPSPYRFRGVPGPVLADGSTIAPPRMTAWGTAGG